MKLKINVGGFDRVIRACAGMAMLYFGFIRDSFLQDPVAAMLLGIFGVVVSLSALFAVCPLYNLIGFNSCSRCR